MASSKMFKSDEDMNTKILLLRHLKIQFHSFRQQSKELAASLDEVAKVYDAAYLDVQIATAGGATAGGLGGTLIVVGGALAPVTAGTSLIAAAAGGLIAVAGSITTGGAAIGECVERTNAVKKAEDIVKKFERARFDIIKECQQVSDLLGGEQLNEDFPLLANFITELIFGTGTSLVWSLALNIINSIVSSGPKFSLDDDAIAALNAGSDEYTGLSGNDGAVVGIARIPLDIGFQEQSENPLRLDKEPDTSTKIFKFAKKLHAACQSEAQIDDAVQAVQVTINKKME